MITTNQLYDLVTEKLAVRTIHPLHKAMLEECCEHALMSNESDTQTLVISAQLAFLACDRTLRATLKASVERFDADEIKLNYRGETFKIKQNSPFLEDYRSVLN